MIKIIQSENVGVAMVAQESIKLTINGEDTMLSIDELSELREVTNHFWDANSLWGHTSEAKAERERHERDYGSLRTPYGLQSASIQG